MKHKLNASSKNKHLLIVLAVFIFAFFSVFGLSLITGSQQQSNIGTSLASAQEPADINSDNVVDIVDLSILLSNWNTTDNLSDINNDNIVDIVDLSILLSKWGAVEGGVTADPSWEEAFSSRDQATIDQWYIDNTGYEALGYDSATFLDISSDNIIDLQWLQANENNGHVTKNGERWTVERVKSNRIRVAESNVTVRGCSVEGSSTLYGVQHYPTTDNSITGTIIEYCAVNGNNSDGTGVYLNGNNVGVDRAIVRNSNIYGWRAGMLIFGNLTAEYNWSHDLYFFEGSHNTSGSNRGANVRIKRNYFADGGSGAFNIYADNLIHNMVIEENIFNTPNALWCMQFPDSKAYYSQTYDTHLINNIFGQKYNLTCGSTGAVVEGIWSTFSGNTFMDGTAVYP